MQSDQIDTFEGCAGDVRVAVDNILIAADAMRDQIETAQGALARCNRSVSTLRRTEVPEMMGPLNSLSAAQARHQSLSSAVQDLETALARFEDIARDLRLLHPDVVTALRTKLELVAAEKLNV